MATRVIGNERARVAAPSKLYALFAPTILSVWCGRIQFHSHACEIAAGNEDTAVFVLRREPGTCNKRSPVGLAAGGQHSGAASAHRTHDEQIAGTSP